MKPVLQLKKTVYIHLLEVKNAKSIIVYLSWERSLIKKGVLCMEYMVRYFRTYYMQLVLKCILIVFIICLPHKLCFSRVHEDTNWKETKVSWCYRSFKYQHKEATKSDTWHCWSCFFKLIVTTNSFRHSQSSIFVKRFFSERQWLYSCLKSQKTIPDYYFYNEISHNRTYVHIIRTVILICH